MTSTRMELRIAPLVGREYTTPGKNSTTPFLDVLENDLDPQSLPFAFHASFRGCCYNPLTRILLVCDPLACCVRTFDVEIRSDTELRLLPRGSIGERGHGAGKFQCPVAVDVNSRGEIAVADCKLNRIAFFTGSGNALHYFGKSGANRGEFRCVVDLKFTALGHVAVVDSENHRVQVMTTTGGLVLVVGRQGGKCGELSFPCAVDIARNGDLFICDGGNKRIQRFSAKGKWLALWGSRKDRTHGGAQPATPQYDGNGIPISPSLLRSVFDMPCDVLVGGADGGEVFVCDSARQEILVFDNTGACLHVIAIPEKPRWSPIAICAVRNSLLIAVREAHSFPPCTVVDAPQHEHVADHKFMVVPPAEKVPTGKLALWPWTTLLETFSYLTYADAIRIRLVNHVCHRACRVLRNEWRLFPLAPGRASVVQYNRVQHKATGRVEAVETFNKWGLRIFKPANRIRKHVMDFEAGFRHALSSLFGPLFFYQHEEVLREVFRFYSNCADKMEIDEAAFVEIVTQINEVRAGLLQWPQCPSLCQLQQIPPIRSANGLVLASESQQRTLPRSSIAPQLTLVENAQQHQLNRLLSRLQQL